MKKRKRKLSDISDSEICDFKKSAQLSSPLSAPSPIAVAQIMVVPINESKKNARLKRKHQKETYDM